MNAINVLETLLAQENTQQTIHIILNKKFVQNDADITQQFLTIQTRCPNLLWTILPFTEQRNTLKESYLIVVFGSHQLHDEDRQAFIRSVFNDLLNCFPVYWLLESWSSNLSLIWSMSSTLCHIQFLYGFMSRTEI